MSACIKISHRGHEIEFHKEEEAGKHFRPGAREEETKQGGLEGRDSNDKSQRDRWVTESVMGLHAASI